MMPWLWDVGFYHLVFVGIARIHIRTAGMPAVFAAWRPARCRRPPSWPSRWEKMGTQCWSWSKGRSGRSRWRKGVSLPSKVNIVWMEDGRYGNYQITSFNTVHDGFSYGKIPIGMEYPPSTRRIWFEARRHHLICITRLRKSLGRCEITRFNGIYWEPTGNSLNSFFLVG